MPTDIGKWTLKILRIVLPLAYAATLFSSINHLAWFFSISDAEVWVQYGLAGSIDLTCFVLGVYAMFCYATVGTATKWIIWGLVIALAAFSWFANWEYAVYHMDAKIFTKPALTPFQDFNGIIQSAFVVFGVIYNKIMQTLTKKAPTAEELQEMAAEINARISAQEALKEAKENERKARGTFAEKIVAMTKEGASAYQQGKAAIDAVKNGTNQQTTPVPNPTTPEKQAADSETTTGQRDEQSDEQGSGQEQTRQRLTIVPGGKKSGGKKVKETPLCWPVEYVADKLGLTVTTVRRMAQKQDCLLVAPRRGAKDYVTKASFAAYQADQAKKKSEVS